MTHKLLNLPSLVIPNDFKEYDDPALDELLYAILKHPAAKRIANQVQYSGLQSLEKSLSPSEFVCHVDIVRVIREYVRRIKS